MKKKAEDIVFRLTEPQERFLALQCRFPLFVGGFGCGKSYMLKLNVFSDILAYPNGLFVIYMPTYSMVEDIAVPNMLEMFEMFGMRKVVYNKTDHKFYNIPNGARLWMKTMEDPAKIAGWEPIRQYVDEIETMPVEQQQLAFTQIIARQRKKQYYNGKPVKLVTRFYTTPNCGTKGITYQKWGINKLLPESQQKERAQYQFVNAPISSNAQNLDPSYEADLRSMYPDKMVDAFVQGLWVNMFEGLVYCEYDRVKCRSSETITPSDNTLYVGMDFNVGHMAAIVNVRRYNASGSKYPYQYHAVREFIDLADTPSMIKKLKSEFPKHKLFIYPDCAGASKKSTDASTSDITLLQQAGYTCRYHRSHPAVKDRVLSVNRALKIGDFMVNDELCPRLAESLSNQAYDKNGDPDKSHNIDHPLDAQGYLIEYEMPIRSTRMGLGMSTA